MNQTFPPADGPKETLAATLVRSQRMAAEYAELSGNLSRLDDFRRAPRFNQLPLADQVLLNRQASAMERYAEILAERIERARITG